MPLFEYKCQCCHATRDILTMSAAKRPKHLPCQSCERGRMNQVAHPRTGAPQFKGKGWARDGYSGAAK
jgi:predicted nucleic acid-binding Zn ribbon protein